ncbi:MAG: hypothetical protein AAF415_13085 [Pseudomonadota bacterium]
MRSFAKFAALLVSATLVGSGSSLADPPPINFATQITADASFGSDNCPELSLDQEVWALHVHNAIDPDTLTSEHAQNLMIYHTAKNQEIMQEFGRRDICQLMLRRYGPDGTVAAGIFANAN